MITIQYTKMHTKKGTLSMRAIKLICLLALAGSSLQAQYGWWGSQDTLNLFNRNSGSVMIGATQPLGKLTLGTDDQMYNLSLIGDWSNMGKNYLRIGVLGNRMDHLQGHVLFDLTHSNAQARYAGYNFRVGGVSRFFINGEGNVGIGTEKPEARLDIKGGPDWFGFNVGMRMPKNNMIRFDAGQAQYGLVALEDEVSFVTSNGSPTAFGSMFSKRFSIQPRKTVIYGDLEVRGNIYSPSLNNGGGSGNGNPTGGGNGDGDSGKDYLLPPGEGDGDGGVATEYWTQDGSMNLSYLPSTGTGNVGIGTTTPTLAKLVVNGAVGGNTVALFGDASPVSIIKDSPIIAFNAYYNAGWKVFTGGKYTGVLGLNPTEGCYFFMTGNNPSPNGSGATMTERMRITNSGNIGIGTTTPGKKLEVYDGADAVETAVLRLNGTTGTIGVGKYIDFVGQAGIGWVNNAASTAGLWMGASTASKSLYVGVAGTYSGNVGIGTTTPGTKLDLYQGTFRVWNGNGTAPIRIYSTGDGTHNNSNVDIWSKGSGGGEELYFDLTNWGNNFYWRMGSGVGMWNAMRLSATGISASSKGSGILNLLNNDIATIQFSANGLTYLNGGKVVIGSTADQGNYTLAVKGTIKAQELYLTTTGWSDFVFDKNYKLRSLSEVERHIKEHKHLPDVPSEKEVIANGVGVVEMQAKLLQKIEELTLYVIEQQKMMNTQRQMIDDQSKSIERMKSEIQQLLNK